MRTPSFGKLSPAMYLGVKGTEIYWAVPLALRGGDILQNRIMKNFKLIFTGPVGAGKTTAIRTVSNLVYRDSDVKASDGSGVRKRTTTVAMDNGVVQLGEGERVHLYGTPGQERFRFMWDILANDIAKDCAALVILIDNTRNYPFRDLKFYLNEFKGVAARAKVIVAVTHADLKSSPTVNDYRRWLRGKSIAASVVQIDARVEKDVLLVIGIALEKVSCFGNKHSVSDAESVLKENDMAYSKSIPPSPLSHTETSREEEVPTVRDVVSRLDIEERTGTAEKGNRKEETDSMKKRAPMQISNQHPEPEGEGEYVEKVVMKDSIVDEVMKIKGVKGAVLMDARGDVIASSFEDGNLMEFIGFFSGIAKAFENAANLGELRSVTLKSSTEDNLTLYMEDEQVLCILSGGRVSVRVLNQQIDSVIQWGEK